MSKTNTAFGLIALAALCAPPQALSQTSQAFGANDINRIAKTSRDNAARFNRDYKGKAFVAKLPVNSISENFLIPERYRATFGTSVFGGNVDCQVKDRPTIDKMMDWNKGQMVTVSGTIQGTILGDIELDHCEFVPHPGQKG